MMLTGKTQSSRREKEVRDREMTAWALARP